MGSSDNNDQNTESFCSVCRRPERNLRRICPWSARNLSLYTSRPDNKSGKGRSIAAAGRTVRRVGLYCDETDTYGVIDFDDAILCWYALDVVRAIDCLSDVAEDIDAESAKAAFLSGYREETAFTDEQMNSLPLMRRLVRVQAYGTLLHVLSEPADTEPDWMTEIIQNLEKTPSDIENTL